MESEIPVWRPTPEEWQTYVEDGLQRLGLSYEELEHQARDCSFESWEARNFWIVIGS